MTSVKYIGMDVHKEAISIAVMNSAGKLLMESIIETKASTILQFVAGLRGDLQITFEEGTWAAWLYDLLKAHVSQIVVCNPRKNALLKDGNKSDRIDARKLADLLRGNYLKPVYHGENGLRMLKEGLRWLRKSLKGCGSRAYVGPGSWARWTAFVRAGVESGNDPAIMYRSQKNPLRRKFQLLESYFQGHSDSALKCSVFAGKDICV
jgi:transposase